MKCPICGTPSRVLETRATDTHATRRTRECDNLHRFPTFEVVAGAINPGAMARAQRGIDNAQRRWLRDRAIRLSTEPQAVVAARHGVSPSRVSAVRSGYRAAGKYSKRGAVVPHKGAAQ